MKTTLPLLLAIAACSPRPPEPAAMMAAGPNPFDAPILEAAGSYKTWFADTCARWAPERCDSPRAPGAKISASEDAGTHGRKLYFLFSKGYDSYPRNVANGIAQDVGQAIVKEAWAPDECSAPEPLDPDRGERTCVSKDGRRWKAGASMGLFVMVKTGGKDTDAGWVYGTVSPEGKVTSAGKIASCMGCHEAQPDRLFGLSSR